MAPDNAPRLPRDEDGAVGLHFDAADALEHGLRHLGEVLALTFGEEVTSKALRVLLAETAYPGASAEELQAEFDRLGWRAYLKEESAAITLIQATPLWREATHYAGEGISPDDPWGMHSVEERKRRVEALVAQARTLLEHGARLFGSDHLYVWEAVLARAALDFGGTVTLEGIQLLAGVSLGAVRNAVSLGELQPDEDGNVPAEQAQAWLARRREFCPSRWTNPDDDQQPFSERRAVEANERGTILVPQDSEGTPFTPEHVVRPAKRAPGLSITVGAKGAEEQHRDFYAALAALAKMDVPRWRRRNGKGNWGIVRARGPWVAVSKAEIDRQLAAKAAEVA